VALRDYEDKLALLTSEIERLQDVLKEKYSEVEKQRHQIVELEQVIRQLHGFESECNRLKEILNNRDRDVDQWRGHASTIEVKNIELRKSRDD